ncbi:hypothetical protein ABPG72_013968 [Tetrahymena utriculariae]
MNLKVLCLLFIVTQLQALIQGQSDNSFLKLILLQDYQNARCLDGTSSGFYFREGQGEGRNNFMIHLQGGAWCQGSNEEEIIDSCLQRSKTSLGSSSFWPQNMTNSANLDQSITNNPAFYNWNVIFVYYCDGFAYQGNSQKQLNSNTTLYFRGKENMISLFDYLQKNMDIKNANRIVLSGSSAGGIGATNWSQYLRSLMPQKVLVQLISDSGFFVDDGWFDPKMWQLQMDIAYNKQRQEIMPVNCQYINDDAQLYKCIQPAFNYYQLELPSLFLLSSYDTYVLAIQKKIQCFKSKNGFYSFYNCSDQQWKIIDELRTKTIQTLQQVFADKKNISVWTVSCINHMFELDQPFYNSGLFTSPSPNGVTASESIVQFLRDPFSQKQYIDISTYPENEKCSYLVASKSSYL